MNDADQIAKKLVDGVRKRCDDLLTLTDEWTDLEATIAAALAAERAKFAAFADEKGEPRKVAGDGIPVSADGVFLTPGAIVWPHGDVFIDDGEEGGTVKWTVLDNNTGDLVGAEEWEAAKCYSTKESALAAPKQEKKQ